MLIAILVVSNIPVYILLGWLAFDNAEDAAETFFETITAVLKTILVPDFVRVLMGMDTSGSWGLFPIVGFLFGCGAVVYGEYVLICNFFGIG